MRAYSEASGSMRARSDRTDARSSSLTPGRDMHAGSSQAGFKEATSEIVKSIKDNAQLKEKAETAVLKAEAEAALPELA